MRRFLISVLLASASILMSAQPHFKVASNPDILRYHGQIFPERTNIAMLKVKVENMWHGADDHLEVEYKF